MSLYTSYTMSSISVTRGTIDPSILLKTPTPSPPTATMGVEAQHDTRPEPQQAMARKPRSPAEFLATPQPSPYDGPWRTIEEGTSNHEAFDHLSGLPPMDGKDWKIPHQPAQHPITTGPENLGGDFQLYDLPDQDWMNNAGFAHQQDNSTTDAAWIDFFATPELNDYEISAQMQSTAADFQQDISNDPVLFDNHGAELQNLYDGLALTVEDPGPVLEVADFGAPAMLQGFGVVPQLVNNQAALPLRPAGGDVEGTKKRGRPLGVRNRDKAVIAAEREEKQAKGPAKKGRPRGSRDKVKRKAVMRTVSML